jgi:hypothetical protein
MAGFFYGDRTGEVSERFNVPDSKSGVLLKVPGVRIPPSPHDDRYIGRLFEQTNSLLILIWN